MKGKFGRSIRSRINLWYTVLMCALAVGLLFSIVATAKSVQRSEVQQNLIRSVERNIDEIEVENGLLDIESDFAYETDGIHIAVYSYDGRIMSGSMPENTAFEIPTEKGKIYTVDGYYVYDTLIEFSKYEYKIDGVTGEVVGSESEGIAAVTEFEGDMDFVGEDCLLSGREVYAIALEKSNIKPEESKLISLGSYEYNNAPIYEIEFYSTKKAHDDIWVRGVIMENRVDKTWDTIIRVIAILLILVILVSSFVGSVITKKAIYPVKLLSNEVAKTRSGNDLTKRITLKDSDPLLGQLAENFNLMFHRLQLSFEAEKQFSADASHELRTPTAVILAECEYQLSRTELDEEDREAFEDIQKQAQSMKSIITQLNYFTKLEQGRETLSLERTDMSELVNELCDDLSLLDEKAITLKRDIDEDIVIMADVMLITRLITNLVSNAYRYGKQGGNIKVSLKKAADSLTLAVADDGIGIAKEHLDKIWNRFYRVDKARSREEGASGLGLAMVKQIALLHGAEVFVESEEGKGSTFYVKFNLG